VLTWKEWWKRHEFLYTWFSKESGVTTGESSIETLSPAVQQLVGRLLKMLQDDDDYYDVRAAAAIALGKIGQNTPEIRRALIKGLKDKDQTVQGASALSLGMIRAVEATNHLTGILKNKREKESVRTRAAVALGLMDNSANLHPLQTIFNAPDTKDEVKAGTLLAMGLLQNERAAYTLYPVLMSNYDEELQALAVAALAKIGTTTITFRRGRRSTEIDIIDLFEKRLAKKTTKDEVRRSIAMALGTIGKEETSIDALKRAYTSDRDKGVKGFALLSLAQMKKGEANKVVVRDFLRRALMREKDVVVRGFAALAVGLSQDQDAGQLLLDVFNSNDRPDVRAAAAVGLGIIKYKPALPDLGQEVKNPRDGGDARGYAAVALGMIGDPASTKYLKSVYETVNDPYLKWMTATGLGLLGHKNRDQAAIDLVKKDLSDGSLAIRKAAVRSIAYFRDDTTIDPLVEQFKEEGNDELRALIVVSLGNIADTAEETPILRRIGKNVNWVAAVRMKSIELLTRLK